MKIGTRVLAGFSAVVAVMGLSAVVAVGGNTIVNNGLRSVYFHRVEPLDQLKVVTDGFAVSIADNTHKVRAGSVSFADGLATATASKERIDSAWKAYSTTELDSTERQIVTRAETAMQQSDGAIDHLLTILAQKDTAGLVQFAEREMYPAIDPVLAAFSDLAVHHAREAKATFELGDRLSRFIRYGALSMTPIVMLLALWLGIWTARYLTRGVATIIAGLDTLQREQIAVLRRGAESMARGDLAMQMPSEQVPLPVDADDELGMLAKGVNLVLAEAASMAEATERSCATLQAVIGEAATLVDAARAGDLSHRANADAYDGAYRRLVAGLNDTLDAAARPLQAASDTLQRVAERDLSARMRGDFNGEYLRLRDALNEAVENVAGALGEIGQATQQVAGASEQVASGSQSLAAGATTSASALEQISASLQELDSQSRTNAESAREAHATSLTARQSTSNGVAQMEDLSTAISDIQSASTATARILKTIEEIAFQTNLLALNAAVEAARAGDAGRGFAVVAEEVRALALRSAEAAKQTAELVERSTRSSARGVSLNSEVLAQLREIDSHVARVTTMMDEINVSSEQQLEGVRQITSAIDQVNQVTQRSAAGSEESASAAEELSSQAATMLGMVRQFTLDGDGLHAPVAASRALRRPMLRVG